MVDDNGTPTKRFSSLKDVCRTCNNNIISKNHPLDLFGDIAKDERIVAHLEKMFGLKITRGDGLLSRSCRSCYVKISKIQAFGQIIFESKAQQERLSGRKEESRLGISRPQLHHRDQKEKK